MQMQFRRRERAPDELGGVRILYPRVKSSGHRIAWYLILLAVLAPILLLLSGVVGSWLALTANGSVFLEQDEIRATAAGSVTRLEVAAGESVRAGQTLAELDSAELDAAAAHNDIERQAAVDARRSAAAAQRSTTDELHLRERLVRYREHRRSVIADLVKEGAATAAELNAAAAATTEAEIGLAQTRAAASHAVPASAAGVEGELLERRRRSLILTAPYDGRVLELLAGRGQYVSPGETLLVVARTGEPHVIAYAAPKFGTRLAAGTLATIRFPDGTRVLASVAAPPQLTQRMPPDLVDQFGLRPMTVVLNLLPQERLRPSERVQGLPVSVRFHYRWELSGVGGALGSLLGVLSR